MYKRQVEDVAKTHLDARMLHSYAMLLNCGPQVYVLSLIHISRRR